MPRWFLCVIGLLLVACPAAPAAPVDVERESPSGERILDYHSDITVAKDGWLTVVETIRVRCEREEIKHGIYRDFPTRYRKFGAVNYVVPFQVVSVLRDGRPEPWHTGSEDNGDFCRVYAGTEEVLLDPGVYTYTFTYRTGRQIGFFADYDELYWNVTGNRWKFPIDAASATVTLPPGVPRESIHVEGYTGPEGAKGKDYKAEVDPAGRAMFHTTSPLPLNDGLTIVVNFPKGFVTPPTPAERMTHFLTDNCMILVGVAGLAVVMVYYFLAWLAVGRDPPKGVIFPLFQAPEGLSPSAVRYILRMGYDNTCFAAGVLSLAVKRCLTIVDDDGDYSLREMHSASKEGLTRDQLKLNNRLFSGSDTLAMKNTNHSRFQDAINGLKAVLAAEYKGPRRYFVTNILWFLPGALLSVLTLLGVAVVGFFAGGNPAVAFLCVWLSFWSIGVFFLVRQVIVSWRAVRNARGAGNLIVGTGGALFITVFALPFVGAEVVVAGILIYMTTIWMLPILLLMGLLNVWFFQLLKQPTREGRKIMDQIEGFRMYLGTAERDLLNAATPPAKTPELFEQFLPYALALGVENVWAEKFADVLAGAASAGEGGWQPAWYTGAAWSVVGATAFASSFSSSFSSALSSASTAPGSSSGSSGGGSSGGGGGGGGGGGW
jgi:uncharacterized membrane protein YgcG